MTRHTHDNELGFTDDRLDGWESKMPSSCWRTSSSLVSGIFPISQWSHNDICRTIVDFENTFLQVPIAHVAMQRLHRCHCDRSGKDNDIVVSTFVGTKYTP